MNHYLVSAILYGISSLLMLLVTFSYMITVFVKPTKTTSALLMHFISCFVLMAIVTAELYSVANGLNKPNFLGRDTRAVFYIITGVFLMYALWEDFIIGAKKIREKAKEKRKNK